MNRTFLIILLAALSLKAALAQGVETDTILIRLQAHKENKNYEAFANEVLQLVSKENIENYDTLQLPLINEALGFIENDSSRSYLSLMINKADKEYDEKNELAKSVQIIEDLNALVQKHGDDEVKANYWLSASRLWIISAQYDKGIEASHRALKYFEKQKLRNATTLSIYSNLVVASLQKADYEGALGYARHGIEMAKQTDDIEGIGNLYFNTANALYGMRRYDEAEESFLKALGYFTQINDSWSMGNAYNALGLLYSYKENFAEASKYLQLALPIFENLNDERYIGYVKESLAYNLFKASKYEKALLTLNEAIALSESGDANYVTGKYILKARIFKKMEVFDSSLVYCFKELEFLKKTKSTLNIEEIYKELSAIEELRGQPEAALEYYKEYAYLTDSIYNLNLSNSIAKEETAQNLDSAVEAQENAELKAELTQSRSRLFMAVAVGLMALLSLLMFFYSKLRKARTQLEIQNQELSQLNQTKNRFFGIIAHDIRGPLSALTGVGEQMDYYLEKNNNEKLSLLTSRIDRTARKLTSLLDNLLNWALTQKKMIPYQPKLINLAEIVNENFELYQEIASLKNIELKNDLQSNSIVFIDMNSMTTVFRNLINNALKFTPSGGSVTVSSSEKDKYLGVTIADTGNGISNSDLANLFKLNSQRKSGTAGEKGSGLGLMLCKELMALNKGKIKVQSELGKGTQFELMLPKSKIK